MLRLAAELVATPLAAGAAASRALPLPDTPDQTVRATHISERGEWDYDLGIKRHPGFVIRPGWLAAILAGHKKVRAGLSIDAPVLSMMSTLSTFGRTWTEAMMETDTVLDVKNLAKRSVLLGPHVTVLRVAGGLHDLTLSRADVREKVMDDIAAWLEAWVVSRSV